MGRRVPLIFVVALMLIMAVPLAYAGEGTGVFVGSVTLRAEKTGVRVNDTLQIEAVITPDDAADKALVWSVSDAKLAAIDGNGLLKGLIPGKVTVRATAKDQGTVYGEIEIQVLPIHVEEVVLSLVNKALCYGAEWPLAARVLPEDATDPALEWVSSNPRVADISRDEKGELIIRAGYTGGTCRLTATAADGSGAEAICEVRVGPPVTDILIGVQGDANTVLRGESVDLTAEVLPSDASSEIRWESLNGDIAQIEKTESGAKLTGIGGGEATLRAAAQDGSGYAAQIRMMVRVPVERVTLPDAAGVFVGQIQPVAAAFFPEDTTDRVLRYSSEDPSVATVDRQGNVKGVAVGQTRITVRAQTDYEIWSECMVTVSRPVTAVLVSADESEIGLNGTLRMDATVSPIDAGDRRVTWSSSNPSVATVDEAGNVNGLSNGQTIVQATAVDGSGVAGVMVVTVKSNLTSIALPQMVALLPGEREILTPVSKPVGLNPGPITWKSADPSVAAVDAVGAVLGVKSGETLVTATTQGGLVAQCTVKVSEELSVIELADARGTLAAQSAYEVSLGETRNLIATASPAGIPVEFTWTSANPQIVSVEKDGAISARKAGTTNITVGARCVEDGHRITRRLTVKVIQPVTAVLLPESVKVLVGRDQQVKAMLAPQKVTYSDVTWATGDSAVAKVDERGVVRGIKPGTTMLTATSHNRLVGLSRVTVDEPVATVALALPSAIAAINPGDQVRVQALVSPPGALQALTWKSSKNAIAQVSSSGVVTARKSGSVKITATAADGSGVKATLTIKIVPAVKKLKIAKDSFTLYVNGTSAKLSGEAKLKWRITPSSASKRPVTFVSNDPEVATVDALGRVTAVKNGIAIVTAATENGCRDEAVIWVKTLPSFLTLARERASLSVKEALSLAVGLKMDGTEDALTWSSSKPAVAKVNQEGIVTAVKGGITTITVKTRNGLKATCVVEVTAKPAPTASPAPPLKPEEGAPGAETPLAAAEKPGPDAGGEQELEP